ncbi:MAG: UUP1 family membrane protein, partial [Myxococcota bacterium]
MKKKVRKGTVPMTQAQRRFALIIAAAMVLTALCVMSVRVGFMGVRLLPGRDSQVWVIEEKLTVNGGDNGGHALLHVPREESGQTIVEEKVLAMKHSYMFRETAANRLLDVTVQPGETLKVFYRAVVNSARREPVAAATGQAGRWIAVKDRSPAELELLGEIAQKLEGEPGSEAAARAVMKFIQEQVTVESAQAGRSLGRLLKKGAANPEDLNALHLDLARVKGIPSRRVWGLYTESSGKAEPVTWVEHIINGHWVMAIPGRGEFGGVGEGVLVLYRGDTPPSYGKGIERVNADFYLWRDMYARQMHPSGKAGLHESMSLYRLPVDTQKAIK